MSALNYNKVILCGRLTAAPELKVTQSGKNVVSFSLAVNRPRSSATEEQGADFPRCVAWEKTAEFIARYFKKGDSIMIEGRVSTRSYTDGAGRKVYATEIVADRAYFVDNKEEAQAPSFEQQPNFEEIAQDQDLPF